MIPTLIITGFLGAGKTTLLNRLVGYYCDRRTVLLINEFGQIGIDGRLLDDGDYIKVELNKGSLFCICVRTDFIDEVERIAVDLDPELLIIEATGLADTSDMEKMLALPNLKSRVRLKACVCLVDCQNFVRIKTFLRAPVSQVQNADLILINKTDLVSRKQVRQTISAVKSIAPHALILTSTYAGVELDKIDALKRPLSIAEGSLGDGRPDPVLSVTLQGKGRFTSESWRVFTNLFRADVLRAKGFIEREDGSFYVDATMDEWRERRLESAPAGENQLIVIGRSLDVPAIENCFNETLSSASVEHKSNKNSS